MADGADPRNPPLVSVVIPVYNREHLVRRAIDSVLQQSLPGVEILAIDDGSTDGTADVLRSYGSRVDVLSQAHAGPYEARNLGIEKSRGDLIAFLDSDDVWYPDRLERQVARMARPRVGMVFGNAALVDHRGGAARRLRLTAFDITPPRRGRAADFAYGNFVPFSSVLVRRECFEACGPFTTLTRTSADYLKWFQIALRYELAFIREPLFEYMLHAGNMSGDLVRVLEARIRLFREELRQADDAPAAETVLHILFALHLHLAVALARRRDWGGVRAITTSSTDAGRVPLARRLAWLGGFVLNQAIVRSRRLTAATAGWKRGA